MPASAWISHVKAYHKAHGGSYSSSMKAAAKTWKSKKAGSSETEKKKAETKKTPKKVRFRPSRTRVKPEETGGSLRSVRERRVKVDRKKAAFTKALYQDYTPDEPSGAYDNEVGMYSHFGGKISGKGARYDPPETVRFLHHTFKKFPKILAAYHAGRVVNPPMPKRKYY